MAIINIRFKAASLDIDTTTKTITGLHVEYDLTAAGVTTPSVWSGTPGAELADDLWAVLRQYLAPVVGAVGVTPPQRPLPGSPTPG